jgi:hypothetical protein
MTTKLSHFQEKIVQAGKELAAINPNSNALKAAREWWKAGCYSQYSNQDFDILGGLLSDLHQAKRIAC